MLWAYGSACIVGIFLVRLTVIFVHGCFWHRHSDCRYATTPKTRQEYWLPKFAANTERDARKMAQLQALGWRVLLVWECETKQREELSLRLRRELKLSEAARDDASS